LPDEWGRSDILAFGGDLFREKSNEKKNAESSTKKGILSSPILARKGGNTTKHLLRVGGKR